MKDDSELLKKSKKYLDLIDINKNKLNLIKNSL